MWLFVRRIYISVYLLDFLFNSSFEDSPAFSLLIFIIYLVNQTTFTSQSIFILLISFVFSFVCSVASRTLMNKYIEWYGHLCLCWFWWAWLHSFTINHNAYWHFGWLSFTTLRKFPVIPSLNSQLISFKLLLFKLLMFLKSVHWRLQIYLQYFFSCNSQFWYIILYYVYSK